ncbi:MAG: ABC transporter substrate-binding protein [Actinomycetota bacterium]
MFGTLHSRRRSPVAALGVATALVLAACGSDASSDDADDPSATEAAASDTSSDDSEVPTTQAPAEPDPPAVTEPTTDTPAPADTDPPSDTEPSDTEPSDTEPPDTEPEFPRTVTHALGETTIPEAPLRIVALDGSLVDAVLALELDLIGYTTFRDPEGDLPAYFGDALTEFAAEADWVGDLTAPNLEEIALLQPDLILSAAVRHEGIYDQLSQIAPTVLTESAGGGWKDSIRLAAEATGRDELAETLLTGFESRAADLGAAINEAAGDPEISVVRVVDVIRLYNPVSFSGTVLEDAGLARPESQRSTDDFITIISEEELDLADGDVVIYTVFDDPAVEDAVADLQAGPLWETLGAVQRGDVHRVSDEEWMSGVGLFGAQIILDDLAEIFGVTN